MDLRFTYYDADNNPIPSPPTAPYRLDSQDTGAVPDLGDTTQRNSVRRVAVTLTAREDLPTDDAQLYTLTADVWMRNVD